MVVRVCHRPILEESSVRSKTADRCAPKCAGRTCLEVASEAVPHPSAEFAAIDTIRRAVPAPPEGETWIGDDAAVVRARSEGSILLAADAIVEGVHFDLQLVDAADVGWKSLAVNVSDIAAMGGRPLHALVTIIGARSEMIEGLARGLGEAAAAYGCGVVGGDISSGACLALSVAITGTTNANGRAVYRSGACPGDQLFVTGPLGQSSAGLRALRAQASGGDRAPAALSLAYRRPQARVAEGTAAAAGGATAMIDVSDGLGIDLDRLATCSGVGVVLDHIPTAPQATIEDAIGGGEDYELVFAASDPATIWQAFDTAGLRSPIRIGQCVSDVAMRRIGDELLPAAGWEHHL